MFDVHLGAELVNRSLLVLCELHVIGDVDRIDVLLKSLILSFNIRIYVSELGQIRQQLHNLQSLHDLICVLDVAHLEWRPALFEFLQVKL